MKLLATISVLLFLSVLVFLSSGLYHSHLVDSLREIEKECLTENRDVERTECLTEVEQSLVVKYYVELVWFVSGISGLILVMVVVHLTWEVMKDWQRRKEKCAGYEMDLARQNSIINAYRKKLGTNKKVESKIRSKVDRYKVDVENAVLQQVEYERGLQDAQREAAFLNMRIQRQNVKDRSNWAKITQLRKREGTLKKELEAKSKSRDELEDKLGSIALEKERLARELADERRERERQKEEFLRERAMLEEAAGVAQQQAWAEHQSRPPPAPVHRPPPVDQQEDGFRGDRRSRHQAREQNDGGSCLIS